MSVVWTDVNLGFLFSAAAREAALDATAEANLPFFLLVFLAATHNSASSKALKNSFGRFKLPVWYNVNTGAGQRQYLTGLMQRSCFSLLLSFVFLVVDGVMSIDPIMAVISKEDNDNFSLICKRQPTVPQICTETSIPFINACSFLKLPSDLFVCSSGFSVSQYSTGSHAFFSATAMHELITNGC